MIRKSGAHRGGPSRKENIPSSSEIRKIVGAANRFGNPGIQNQQLTTMEIFHYLAVGQTTANGQTFDFFRNVNTAAFPYANIQENRLQVGETMVINRVHFTLAKVLISTGEILEIRPFGDAAGILTTASTGLYLSQFSWSNDNNRVIKTLSLTNMQPEFNRKGFNINNNVFHLETDITIQPLIRFVCQLEVPLATLPKLTEGQTWYIGCHATGTGTLLAPKTTY
ncbi:MAG: hypothetical protein WCH21_02240 [Bacteroidota bacterium]